MKKLLVVAFFAIILLTMVVTNINQISEPETVVLNEKIVIE